MSTVLLACRNPLPPLFMRFTIQTLNAAPRLKGFVLDILSNLVNKQVPLHCTCFFSRPSFCWLCVLPAHLFAGHVCCESPCMTDIGCTESMLINWVRPALQWALATWVKLDKSYTIGRLAALFAFACLNKQISDMQHARELCNLMRHGADPVCAA